MTRPDPTLAAAATGFLAAIIAANALTQHHGMVPIIFGLTATAGTYAAGITFTLRDAIDDRTRTRWPVAALIAAGTALSAIVAPDLAIASGTAFAVAELADWAIYSRLRARSWDIAVWASLAVGAIADSVLFLRLAPFPLTARDVAGQVAGKIIATLPIWALLRWARTR